MAAEGRAQALLESVLTTAQRTELKTYKRVTIPASVPGLYRYELGFHHLSVYVHRVRGTIVTSFCVAPDLNGYLPPSDVMLTILVWLLGDRRTFLRKANRLNSWYSDRHDA